MRIDLLLNKLCLVKTRSIAKKACDKNLILINGQPSKASQSVFVGDQISIALGQYKTLTDIVKIPDGNVAKKDAGDYYKIISKIKIEIND
ncbi:MAG: S4 domain-containing protein [Candidatus Zophobacter franzmannii]|nr:S4 domain-containing protein [Candidatus Zophobacter franzmannii]